MSDGDQSAFVLLFEECGACGTYHVTDCPSAVKRLI
jgi:hypothetical protein